MCTSSAKKGSVHFADELMGGPSGRAASGGRIGSDVALAFVMSFITGSACAEVVAARVIARAQRVRSLEGRRRLGGCAELVNSLY